MRSKWVYGLLALVAILVTSYPLAFSYLSGQSGNSGQYLCAPVIPCQPPASGVQTCTTVCIVNIENATFTPGTVRVVDGATIKWVNHDGFPHTANPFNSSAWRGGVIPPGGSLSITVERNMTVGVYYYNCLIHPDMIGEVVVLSG